MSRRSSYTLLKHDLGNGAELRILERRHAQEFLEFVGENREHLSQWLGWAETLVSLEDAEAFIKRGLECFVSDGQPRVGFGKRGNWLAGSCSCPFQPNYGLPKWAIG